MGKYKILLYLVALGINRALTMYYACPPTSVCVPPKNCKPENVTFNTTSDENDQEFKYICGVLAQCEGHVCCNDPINLPPDFEPNKTQWCYSEESFADPLKIDVQVYPYPGLEEPQSKENMLHIDTLCPAGSICVSGSMCPIQYISYSYGFSGDEFKCGSHPGSIGNICCTISGIFEPMFKVPHTKPHFMKKRNAAVTKRESRWSFMNSDYFPSNNVVMRKQNLYKEVSGKSTKPQEKNEFNYALRAASFYVIDNTQCQNSLRKVKELGAFFKLQKRVLCAKGYSNADTCKGDGGSGLVCRDKDVYVLKGLVSYGFGCGLNLPGVYTDVEKYLDFINNYKKFISSSSDFSSTYIEQNFSPEKPERPSSKISTSDVDGTYTKQKFYSQEKLSSSGHKVSSADIDSSYTEHKLYFPEEQKYISDLEPEDKIPVYITVQDEKNDQPAYITIQGERTDQSKKFQGSSKNYVDKSPVKIDYTNQFTQISSPYETREDGEYTYIKVQEPEYIERPKFSPNLYEPEEKVNFYTQSSIKDSPKYEENFPHSSYEFSNSRDDSNYISKSEYKSEKSQYDDEESFENTYKPTHNREGYSDRTDTLNYNSRPNYNELDYSTLNNFGDKLSYKPDHTRLIEDTFHQPDYIRPNEDLSYQPEYKTNEGAFYQPNYIKPKEEKLSYQKDYERTKDTIYQPDYTRPNEDVLSYEPDYTRPNEDVLSYKPDYTRPNDDVLSYEPDYTRPNEDLLSYESDYTRPNEDVLSYEPDYTRPNEDVLSYEPEYKTNDDRFYRPNKSPYEDGILYQPDYTRSDYPIQSDQLDYEAPSFNYLPANNLERYNAPEENYKGASRPTNYYTPQDELYYEDLDHLRYGRGLKYSSRIFPKDADVKTYSKKASGKASGESGNILSVFSPDSSVRRGKVVSPLAMLKRKFWVK